MAEPAMLRVEYFITRALVRWQVWAVPVMEPATAWHRGALLGRFWSRGAAERYVGHVSR